MRSVGRYDIEDSAKIQGRDDVLTTDRSLAAIRLKGGLEALSNVYGDVLVLGCGAGRYVRALQRERPDLSLHGGDLSLTALKEARRRDSHASYLALDSTTLPYKPDSFGAILFFDLLEHVPDYRGMMKEIERVLRPGGVLHFFVPLEGKSGTIYSLFRDSERVPIRRWKRDHVGHVNHFTGTDVMQLVRDIGLDVTHYSFGFHLAGQVHDLIDYWQRERTSGGSGLLPVPAVKLLSRLMFIPTWRLSYLEDRLYSGQRLASGLHLTAIKPRPSTHS